MHERLLSLQCCNDGFGMVVCTVLYVLMCFKMEGDEGIFVGRSSSLYSPPTPPTSSVLISWAGLGTGTSGPCLAPAEALWSILKPRLQGGP